MTQASSPDPRDDKPVCDGSNLIAFLHVLKKAHTAVVGHDKAHQRFHQVATRGHAKQYIEELMPQLLAERDRHRRRRGSKALPVT
jgi:hypothetical protein